MAWSIKLAMSAKAELVRMKAKDRSDVIDAIKRHLADRPDVEEGTKKVLRGLVPPWHQVRPVWQLTVVPFRVFYDVDTATREVTISAIREKPAGKTTKEIL